MKNILTLASILLAFGWSAQAADTSVKLSNVHLCCNNCVKGVDKALSGVIGAKAQSDKDAGTATLRLQFMNISRAGSKNRTLQAGSTAIDSGALA